MNCSNLATIGSSGDGVRFGVSVLALVACLSGCAVPRDAELDRAKEFPGVIAVKVRPTMWDIEPRTADDVHILMDSSSKPEEVKAVADAYANDLKHGEVQMLAIVIKGASAYRSRLYPDPPVSRELVADLLAAADDPNVIRYGDMYNAYRLDFALAKADLPMLATAVDRKLRIEGVKAVYGESGSFNIQLDPVTEDARLARRRLKFALEMNRHIRLTGAGIGGYEQDPSYGGLNLHVAELDLATATEYVRTHRTPGLGKVDLIADSGVESQPNPDEAGTEVWMPPFPSAEELAAAKEEAKRYGATLVTP